MLPSTPPTPKLSMLTMTMLPIYAGWEWGYWLSDVVTARASWDPLLSDDIKAGTGARTYSMSMCVWVGVRGRASVCVKECVC